MGRLRESRWARLRGAALAVLLVLSSCSGDDDDADAGAEETVPHTTTTVTPEAGGLDIPEIAGTFAAPVPSLGFGIAIPETWQATLLTPDALARVAEADLADETFLEAARNVAATGALFYAAGRQPDDSVAEIKVDQEIGVDTGREGVLAEANAVLDAAEFDDASLVELDAGRVRVDFVFTLRSAEDESAIETVGSQLFVPDGDTLWSIIVTAEDAATHAELRDIVEESFVVD